MGNEMLCMVIVFLLLSIGLMILVLGGAHRAINMRELLLQERRERITKKRISKLTRIGIRLKQVLQQSGATPKLFAMTCVAAAAGGFVGGYLLFSGILLAIATGIAATPLPYLIFFFRAAKARRVELDQLEQSMSTITNTFANSYDIVASVEQYNRERHHGIPNHLRVQTPFDAFVTNATLTFNSVDRSLQILESQINNHYFSDWIKTLRMCSKDRGLVSALFPIIQSMSDSKLMQIESDTKIEKSWRDFLSTVAVMFGIIPMLRFSNEEWYMILVDTPVGKFMLILMLLSALLSSVFVMRAVKPDVK
jgi:Flp pilus assembly protein TadB